MKNGILIFVLGAVMLGCLKENELKKSVLTYDPENTNLPVYSEWGYNTFGAYYDRQVFISNDEVVPAKIIVKSDTVSFVLGGQYGALEYHSYYQYGYKKMFMTFELPGYAPADYTDLTLFDKASLDLTDPAYRVSLSIDSKQYQVTVLEGRLTFNRAQNLLVDKAETEVILSGHFAFQAIVDGNPITVSEGRFDVGIGPDNFYKY